MSEKDVFGSPNAHDSTAEWDADVETAAQEHAEMFDVAKQNVLNRQLGSKKVPRREQMREYELMRDDPAHLSQFLTDQRGTLEENISYCFEMENLLRNG